jgi:hypothetical protein
MKKGKQLTDAQRRALDKLTAVPTSARSLSERENTLRKLCKLGLCKVNEPQHKEWEPFTPVAKFYKSGASTFNDECSWV